MKCQAVFCNKKATHIVRVKGGNKKHYRCSECAKDAHLYGDVTIEKIRK